LATEELLTPAAPPPPGKTAKQALVVVAVKLLHAVYAMLKHRQLCLPLIRPIGSRRTPEVFVMESTHAWHLHHPALARRLRTPRLGRVLGQR